jgi:solute carrier family 32 (vesicular inhibitory amino acid transporter)
MRERCLRTPVAGERRCGGHADHVKLLLQQAGVDLGFSDATLLMLALAVVLPTMWLSDLAALSYVGAAGVFSAIAITGILGYFYATAPAAMPTDLVHLDTLPLTFGLMAFVFAGHAVFPTIYHSLKMEERSNFPRVIDASFVIVAVVCSVVGFTGYSCYGSSTLEEVTV